MVKSDYIFCRWERWENTDKKRYYVAVVERDLLNDWGITCHWGGLGSRKGGGFKRIYCESYQRALSLGEIKIIRNKRGYTLTEEK